MKNFLYILITVFLTTACVTERKVVNYIEDHPSILNRYLSLDTGWQSPIIDTIYKPDSIPVYIPGEIKYVKIPIEIPCPKTKDFVSDTAYASTKSAEAWTWISDGKIHLILEQIENFYKIRYDSARMIINILESRLITETLRPPPEKIPVKWYYKAALWGFVGMIFLLIVLIVILKLLKRLPKL